MREESAAVAGTPAGELEGSAGSVPCQHRAPEQLPWWAALRPLLLRMHFYGGLLIAPFLFVADTTGLLYAFTPQLEQILYDHELHVLPERAAQPLAVQVESARAVLPQATLESVRPAPTPADTTRVIFDAPGHPDSFYRTAFIDPYTTEVRGSWKPMAPVSPCRFVPGSISCTSGCTWGSRVGSTVSWPRAGSGWLLSAAFCCC